MHYDAEDRVHIRYVGPDNEQGCFPGHLLNQFSAAPEEKTEKRPWPSTEIQESCGHGDDGGVKEFWATRTGRRW